MKYSLRGKLRIVPETKSHRFESWDRWKPTFLLRLDAGELFLVVTVSSSPPPLPPKKDSPNEKLKIKMYNKETDWIFKEKKKPNWMKKKKKKLFTNIFQIVYRCGQWGHISFTSTNFLLAFANWWKFRAWTWRIMSLMSINFLFPSGRRMGNERVTMVE